jgi:GMP synthase (glutamine-hydrolysing)
MASHERACVRRRIGVGNADVIVRNAVDDEAGASWLDDVDAVIVGGSGDYSVHHPGSEPWVSRLRHLLDGALDSHMPGFGICFGHQLLGYHLGARVETDQRAEVGTIDVQLTPSGASDELFSTLDHDFPVHTGHSDHVVDIPDDLELLASAPTLDTQAFRVRGTRFYTTQFHPDLTGAEAVARYRAFAETNPDALPNLARFRPGADVSVSLLRQFVTLASQAANDE